MQPAWLVGRLQVIAQRTGDQCIGESGHHYITARTPDADGTWIEFLDPDGIALRLVHTATPTASFLGVTFGPDGKQTFYAEPKLKVPTNP